MRTQKNHMYNLLNIQNTNTTILPFLCASDPAGPLHLAETHQTKEIHIIFIIQQQVMQRGKKKNFAIVEKRYQLFGDFNEKSNNAVTIYEGYDIEAEENVSVKVVNHDYIFKNKSRQERKKIYQIEEQFNTIMKECHHQNICQIHKVIMNDSESIYILDPVGTTTLDEQLILKGYLHEYQALLIISQLISALESMSHQSLICKFLNQRTVKFYEGVYKIGNFKIREKYFQQELLEMCLAPEIINNQPYNEKVDIWSLGVLLFLMVDRTCKYREKFKSFQLFINSENWMVDYCSLETRGIMKSMLNKNSAKRISLDKLKEEVKLIILDMKAKGKEYDLPSRLMMVEDYGQRVKSIIFENGLQNRWVEQNGDQLTMYKSKPMERIKSEQIEVIEINKDEAYERYKLLYFETLKSQYMFKTYLKNGNIIQQLPKKIQFYEAIYMIASRIFFNFSAIRHSISLQYLKEDKNSQLLESLTILIQPFNEKIIKVFNQFSAKLTEKEDKKRQVVKRRFRIISDYLKGKDDEKKKDKFLQGVQGVDFTKEEQIYATMEMLFKQKLYEKVYKNKEEQKAIQNYKAIESLKNCELPGLKLEDYIRKAYYAKDY